jgi:hypothetical protein
LKKIKNGKKYFKKKRNVKDSEEVSPDISSLEQAEDSITYDGSKYSSTSEGIFKNRLLTLITRVRKTKIFCKTKTMQVSKSLDKNATVCAAKFRPASSDFLADSVDAELDGTDVSRPQDGRVEVGRRRLHAADAEVQNVAVGGLERRRELRVVDERDIAILGPMLRFLKLFRPKNCKKMAIFLLKLLLGFEKY